MLDIKKMDCAFRWRDGIGHCIQPLFRMFLKILITEDCPNLLGLGKQNITGRGDWNIDIDVLTVPGSLGLF